MRSNDKGRLFAELIKAQKVLDAKKFIDEHSKYINNFLIVAATFGSDELVKYLVDQKKAKIHYKDLNSLTALHYAALFGYLSIVRYLVDQKGADINTLDKHNANALQHAAFGEHLDTVKYLIEHQNADRNSRSVIRAIVNAVYKNNLPIVKYFIEEQRIPIGNAEAKWLTQIASTNNHDEILQYLNSQGIMYNPETTISH
jgi:ankyrin repeat protein